MVNDMAKYDLDYGALNELADELVAMDENLKSNIKDVAESIGKELKANTETAIPRSAFPKHGVHLADDVKMSVKATDKKATITVKGGAKTGKLWWAVDNGHVAQNGFFVPGVHFTDKAYNATNVSGPVDELIEEVLNN